MYVKICQLIICLFNLRMEKENGCIKNTGSNLFQSDPVSTQSLSCLAANK